MSIFISIYLLVCRHCISNQWIAEGIDEKKSPFLFLMNPEFHNKRTVLTPSFRPKRSGVEKSHADVGRAPWWQKISRLSVSIESKAFTPISAGPPLEIRMSMSSIQSFSGGSTDQNAAPHLVISTVGAEWRNLTPKRGEPHGGRRSLGSAFQ